LVTIYHLLGAGPALAAVPGRGAGAAAFLAAAATVALQQRSITGRADYEYRLAG
jgi:hypothetical protein